MSKLQQQSKTLAKIFVILKSSMDERDAKIHMNDMYREVATIVMGTYYKFENLEFWSPAARETYENYLEEGNAPSGFYSKKLVRVEHSVPVGLVLNKIFEADSEEEISDLIESYAMPAIVLKSEDKLLNEAGLRTKMPADWDGKDKFARYTAAGFEVVSFN